MDNKFQETYKEARQEEQIEAKRLKEKMESVGLNIVIGNLERELLEAWKRARQFAEEADAAGEKGLEREALEKRAAEASEREGIRKLEERLRRELEQAYLSSEQARERDRENEEYYRRTAKSKDVRSIAALSALAVACAGIYKSSDDGDFSSMFKDLPVIGSQLGAEDNAVDADVSDGPAEGDVSPAEDTGDGVKVVDIGSVNLAGLEPCAMDVDVTSNFTQYPGRNMLDGSAATCWEEGVTGFGTGEVEARFEMRQPVIVRYLTFRLGRWNSDDPADTARYYANARPKTMTLQVNDSDYYDVFFEDEKKEWVIDLGYEFELASFKLTLQDAYEGSEYKADVCITEVTAFGYGSSEEGEIVVIN